MIAKMTKKSTTIIISRSIEGNETTSAYIDIRRPSFLDSTRKGLNMRSILSTLSAEISVSGRLS